MPWDEVTRRLYHDPAPWLPDLDTLSDEELTVMGRNREALALYTWEPYMHNPKLRARRIASTCPRCSSGGRATAWSVATT